LAPDHVSRPRNVRFSTEGSMVVANDLGFEGLVLEGVVAIET